MGRLVNGIGLTEIPWGLPRTGKVRDLRFETLLKLCFALDGLPGDVLQYDREEPDLYTRAGWSAVEWGDYGISTMRSAA